MIHQENTFNCGVKQLFAMLTDAEKFGAFTDSKAEIDASAGGKFSLFGGMISGQTIEPVADQYLVQAWRAGNWEPGIYSIAKFEFKVISPTETALIFDHSGYPAEFESHLTEGWNEQYWGPMRNYLEGQA